MNHKLIITNYQDGIATALFSDGKAVELSYECRQSQSLLGNIYVGKVAGIAKNIRAAFVEIEDRTACYLALDDSEPIYTTRKTSTKLAAGDEILVQVSRENVKTKAPSVTTNISLTGRYLVLTAGKKQISTSAKLSVQKRKELLLLAAEFSDERFGWIIRTNAASASGDEIVAEAAALKERYLKLLESAQYRPCRSCLYRNPAEWLNHIQDIYDDAFEQILTDDAELYKQVEEYLQEHIPAHIGKLAFYEDRLLPLSKLYPLESAFDEALRQRIWLKSGAYLVIQPTEALTVIDVNTGKFERGKAKDAFLKVNLEAALEAARQIRLRNLSGIILIDFINMESEEQNRQLLTALDEALKKDPIRTVLVDMTKLGLVEITRKRVHKPLAEKLGKAGNLA